MSERRQGPPPSRRRRLLKLSLSLAALLFLAVLLLPLLASTDSARAEAERRASLALGQPVGIESLRLSLLTGPSVTLKGLTVDNPPGFFGKLGQVRQLRLDLALSSLWSRRLTVTALEVKGADLHLIRRANGKMNLAGAAASAPSGMLAAASLPPVLQVNRILLEDSRISLDDQAAGVKGQAEGIALDARVSELSLEQGLPLMAALQHAALDGSLRMASVHTEGLLLESLRCRLLLDAGLARLDGGEAVLNGGPLHFEASTNLQDAEHPAFTFKGGLEKVRLTPAFGQRWLSPFLAGFGEALTGEIPRADLDLAWKGTSLQDVNASLTGKGEMALAANLDLAPFLPPSVPVPVEMARFSRASARFTVGGGVVQNALRLETEGSAADLSGTMRLADLNSDYHLVCSGILGKSIPWKVHLTGRMPHLKPEIMELLLDGILKAR